MATPWPFVLTAPGSSVETILQLAQHRIESSFEALAPQRLRGDLALIPIAYLTARSALDRSRDPYVREHDLQFGALRVACADRGLTLTEVIWDDPTVVPTEFVAAVIGTTWDYAARPEEFLATLELFAEQRPLYNPLPIVRWNHEKTYLEDLRVGGAPVIPTLWRDRADSSTLAAAFDELDVDEVVVKPVIGASSWRQVRLGRHGSLPRIEELPTAGCMIQPFVPTVVSDGEYSFLFFDCVFSHAVRKRPKPGEYRVQSNYGGREESYEPTAVELAAAQRVIDMIDEPTLYARVDLVRDARGELMLMELELIEPYFYPGHGPATGERFAAGLLDRLRD